MREIDRLLDRYEPDTPPSERYNRLVDVGAARVLEMRDPNDGQSPDRADKTRHQYVVAGGMLWYRMLPPESVGNEWTDMGDGSEPEHIWRVHESRAELVRAYRESAQNLPVAVLRREVFLVGDEPLFTVRGEDVEATDENDVRIIYGPITDAWWDVPLPRCPDCLTGHVVWWEAGYVPGTRKCVGQPIGRTETGDEMYAEDGGCGSMYTVKTER